MIRISKQSPRAGRCRQVGRGQARVKLARFRVDSYRAGEHDCGDGKCYSSDPGKLNGVHYFESVEAAAAHWLKISWGWESADPPEPEKWDPTREMLNEQALIFDRRLDRLAAVVSHRPARRGESRRPVAMIVNLQTGSVAEQTIEQARG